MFFISILLVITLIYLYVKLNKLEAKIDQIVKRDVLNTINAKRSQKQFTHEDTQGNLKGIKEVTLSAKNNETSAISQTPPLYVCKSVDLPSEEVSISHEVYPVSNSIQDKNQTKLLDTEVLIASVANSPEKQIGQKSKRKSLNYERLIGTNIFSKIGIIVLIIGIGYFIKYAIDNEWVNETMRSVLSYFFGISLLGIAQKLRKNYRTFSSLLAGGTFAIFYLTTALSYHYYAMFSQTTAFAILIGTTISMIGLSMLYNRKELSIISVVGGFIAPFIFGDESGSITVLLSYITLLNVAMFIISMRKGWSELPLLCFAFTCCIVVPLTIFSESSSSITIISFATLFYLIFLISTLRIQTLNLSKVIRILYGVLFGINNIIYFGIVEIAISYLDLSLKVHGLIPIFIATVNVIALAVTKKCTTKTTFDYLKLSMLGVIIISLTIAVPTQLNENITNVVWALEIIALLILYAKTRIRLYNIAALAMYVLTTGSLLIYALNTEITLGYLISIAIIGGAFFLSANVLRRYKEIFNVEPVKYNPFNPIFIFSGVVTYVFMIISANELVNNNQLILITGFIYLTLLIHILPYRFSIKSYANAYLIAASGFFVLNLIYLDKLDLYAYFIQFTCVVLSMVKIAVPFIKNGDYKIKQNNSRVIAFNIIIYLTCFFMTILWLDLEGLNLSWTISIISVIIAFVQILIGMKVQFKLLRIIGIYGFGFVLVKLVLIDLWGLSSGGKITTLILLGIILLTLSFLYQKVQPILFKDEHSNKNETTDEK